VSSPLPPPGQHIALSDLIDEIRRSLRTGASPYSPAFLLLESLYYLSILHDPFDLSETREKLGRFEAAMESWLNGK
jgi:hypothetical protein